VSYEPKLTTFRRTVSRSWCGGAFTPAHLAVVPSVESVSGPEPGFTPTRLWFPFGVRIGLPLCMKRTMPQRSHLRKPKHRMIFANYF
jgi:hypothetical protein